MKTIDYVALALVIIGAINWGLIGFFGVDLIRMMFGEMTVLTRILYAIAGIAGIYALSYFGRIRNNNV